MIETYIVDAFTDRAFKGNPAGVCILLKPLEDGKMLSIANELGLSETAFIQKYNDDDKYSIRYFSPKMEIPLCGHATLATSKVLFVKGRATDKIHFVTHKKVNLMIREEDEMIIMEFPLYQTEPANAPQELLDALGLKKIINSEFSHDTRILLLEIESSEILRKLSPDFQALYRSHNDIDGVLITSRSSTTEFDFESRYFWPWSGTNEDPVTGLTHTFLASYWSPRLGKSKMKSFQCSGRTGFMEVEIMEGNKLAIKSSAQIILEGRLSVD